ncbi:late competence development ComFB family protein [Bacillus paralicheniformis]|jgi:competence protein ComFB|uniref:Competence protein FB n=1 Tax=Bacillus paralicheniformis TaxID=1648923 RepID=A0A6N2FMM3_9BACI|nr:MULTISPECIES: late competence development ComFB family protein [Bacillus]ETB71749.1 competence protein ComF [Bacillus sp. CPSM8]KJD56027.1 competence protein ComF [Bacillus amyloliquefaciens]KUL13901.1 competence protein ComF [Bacillus licheniformis LMG 7559]MBC8621528.1 late competence development ComFB family protein [Robertmurraya crescens]POO81421.1 competence protein ComFB [Bacillus sp. MBGLi97]
MLVNAKEAVLEELFDQYIEQLHMSCKCSRCREDVLALALNAVKPQYVTDESKLTYIKAELVDKQKNTSMLVTLAEAARKVNDNPLCESNRKGRK